MSAALSVSFGWINHAPIVVLQPDEVGERLERFRHNLRGWREVVEPFDPLPLDTTDPSGPDIDVRDWKDPKRSQQERWNDRLRSTRSMLNMSFKADHVIEYRVDGQPAALMALNHNDPLYVSDLVCHPGSADGGGIMIEYAVNYAVVKNESHDPIVTLWALDDDAMHAYLALGFKSKPGSPKDMTLDLSDEAAAKKGGIWQKTATGWRLAKHLGTKSFLA